MPNTNETDYTQKLRELFSRRCESPPLALVHSYGCQQNVSDGEKLKGMLAQAGFGFTERADEADFILYNTCAVRENAEDRVLGNVGALKPLKRQKPGLVIGLCGCMMQQGEVAERIKDSYPYVDLVFGTHALPKLPELLYRRMNGEKRQFFIPRSDGEIVEGLPLRREEGVRGSLPIMYGCDNFCSYCVVPYVRGRERSRQPGDILREAGELIDGGYRELMLLGQNVNSYGKKLAEPMDFSALLRRVDALPGDFWIRFMTSHPKDCTKKLIDTIAQSGKVCRHIHLPVQSGSDRVLSAMNRRYTAGEYLSLVSYARRKIPGVTFSSDIIVGFPGEIRGEFLKTLELIRAVEYHTLYTFIFSPRPGTKAASLPDPVPYEEKSLWLRELLETQNGIRDRLQQRRVGSVMRVLCEGEGKGGDGFLSGRSESNDIVEFLGPRDSIGNFVDVKIDRALNWALFGKINLPA